MSVRVVLRAELDGGLHGDVGLVSKAMAAVGWWWAVTGVAVRLGVGLWFNLNHPAYTGAEREEGNTP